MTNQNIPTDLVERVIQLQNIMRARATHRSEIEDDELYASLRTVLMEDQTTSSRMPLAVRTCRTLEQFWEFIQPMFDNYAGRRQYLQEEFAPLLTFLENQSKSPGDRLVDDALNNFSIEEVQRVWERAIERRESDPEAAITAARSLVESVCKHILDEEEESYEQADDLKQLYQKTARQMNYAPDQQSEQEFRRLAGACSTIVNSLFSIRNRYGDAHGRSGSATDPSYRHAELAVNVAGSLATFLVTTWSERRQS